MLPTNYDVTRARYPALARIFDGIEGLVRSNPGLKYIDAVFAGEVLGLYELANIAVVLGALAADGILVEKLAVVAPTNYMIALDEDGSSDGIYDAEDEIPEQLHDTTFQEFSKDEGEILSVYVGRDYDR